MDTVTVGSGQYARGRNILGKARYKGCLTCVSRTSHQEKGLEKQSITSGTWFTGTPSSALGHRQMLGDETFMSKALCTKLDSEVT